MADWITWLDRRLIWPATSGTPLHLNNRLIALREWLGDRERVNVDDILAWRNESPTIGRRSGVSNDMRGIGWRRVAVRTFAPCVHEPGATYEGRTFCSSCGAERLGLHG